MRPTFLAIALLASAAVPYTFSSNTPAKAAEVNANFMALDQGLAALATDVAAVKATVTSLSVASKTSTPENDVDQIEDGTSRLGEGDWKCGGGLCVNRLTTGPFVLTNTEQETTGNCLLPCTTELVGIIAHFPAPDDASALLIAAASARPRWKWASTSSIVTGSVFLNDQTGIALRHFVKRGENLYAYHYPSSNPPMAGSPPPSSVVTGAVGYWSGFHPY